MLSRLLLSFEEVSRPSTLPLDALYNLESRLEYIALISDLVRDSYQLEEATESSRVLFTQIPLPRRTFLRILHIHDAFPSLLILAVALTDALTPLPPPFFPFLVPLPPPLFFLSPFNFLLVLLSTLHSR